MENRASQNSAACSLSDSDPLLVVAFLARALSHQLRTPLSVVLNDLVYFKSILPEGECDRAIDRCKQISELLRIPCALPLPPFPIEARPMREILCGLFPQAQWESEEPSSAAHPCNPALLTLTGGHITSLLENSPLDGFLKTSWQTERIKAATNFSATIAAPSTLTRKEILSFRSFSEVFLALDSSSPLPALIDVSLWALAVESAFKIEGELLRFVLTFHEVL